LILKATQQSKEPVRADAEWSVLGGCTLAQPGDYNWTVRVRRRCGLRLYQITFLFV